MEGTRRARAGTVSAPSAASTGSQTLTRGLDVLEAVAAGVTDLAGLSARLGTTRSTTHRLAAALVERRYLKFVMREGYSLGPKLLELGFDAQQQMPVPSVAHPHLERLAGITEDTVHLGVLDGQWALYLDKIPGRRRIVIGSRIGERHPVWSTGLGKALILDQDEACWRQFFALGTATGDHYERSLDAWLARMRDYSRRGHAFDLEENEHQIRCVAAPVRDASGGIVAAISVSSAAQYMDDARMAALTGTVQETARAISRELGWNG